MNRRLEVRRLGTRSRECESLDILRDSISSSLIQAASSVGIAGHPQSWNSESRGCCATV